jgi:iron complex transport system substrate-binding protein
MIKKIFYIVVCCLMVGCINSPVSESTQFTVQDALERTLEFSGYPERIVISGKQTPMLANFFYLFPSKAERLLAVENRSQSPDKFLELIDDEYQSKLILEKGAGVEQIAPLNPDLVILKTSMKEEIGTGLEEVGIPVIYVSFEDIENIYNDIRVIGKVLDEEERAEEIIHAYQKIYSEINDKLMLVSSVKNVLLLQATNIDQKYSFQVPSSSWLQTKMIEDLKANPVWVSASLSGGWTEVNFEQIFNWDINNIFIINYRGQSNEITMGLKKNELWKSFLSDNQANLAPFPYDYISWDQPDPRWILGYTWIASELYPEQIERDYVLETVKIFYTFFYGMGEDYIESEIISLISIYLE